MFAEDNDTAVKRFMEYNEADNDDRCLDDAARRQLTDEEARIEIDRTIGNYKITDIKSLLKAQRDEVILRIKRIEGLQQRKLARIIGISPNILLNIGSAKTVPVLLTFFK
ncbi:MAG: hypothetical protein N3I35_00500 [Clostridia bacterium]|nr:hypothetical protein [Clostridia bacterium]